MESKSLNEAQREALMHKDGPMLVLAGPGSGKTFTITNRISYLISHFKISPGQILVITFTKEAAINMRNRFFASQEKMQPVNFGTFHAVFYQMLKQSGCRKADSVLTDSDKKKIIIPILKDYKKSLSESFEQEELYEDAGKFLAAISYLKNTGNQEKSGNMLEEPYRSGWEQIFTAYEKKRNKSARMDFDDMLYECLKMLRDRNDILKRWQKQFAYLLIDEFQDINPMQYEIIKLLAGEKRNLFAVGDDDQSIYGFRGSDPYLMKQFLSDYPGCRQVLLDTNYRSVPGIVEASLKVIGENRNRFPKQLKAAGASETSLPAVACRHFPEKAEQYRYLLSCLQTLSPQEQAQTAVLFRTNAQMQGFGSLLLREKIPYVMKEKSTCIYDHFIAKDIRNYILFACGDRRRSLFLTIMNKPSRWINRESLEEETVDFEKLRAYYRSYASPKQLSGILLNLGELEDGLKRLSFMKPYLGMNYLRKGMGYDGYLNKRAGTDKRKLAEWMEFLEFLTEEAKQFSDYREWLDYQEAYRLDLEKKKSGKAIGKGVQLMTVHASKGLEFDRVWIPDVNEGTFPHGHMLKEDTVEEERRILYVAMTRAKKCLELTWVTGTKERPRLVSRFLNPIIY